MPLEPDPPVPAVPRMHRQSIVEVLARYGLALAGEPVPIAASVLNQNYMVGTVAGRRFIRFHRKSRTRERLETEQDVIHAAAGRGIPAIAAISDGGGRWLHSLSNQFISVYPWIEGETLRRGAIGPGAARTLGDLHGRLHATLRDYSHPKLPTSGTGTWWDREESIEVLGRVDDLIRYYPSSTPEQLRIQDAIRRQMDWLQTNEARPANEFAGLRRQCCHGDYHERNVIMDAAGGVAAVVDWEITGMIPPVFEVLRALSFMELWAPELSGPYLTAYRTHATLEDCEAGVEMWWQAQLHSTWVYRARFIEGTRAAGQFLEPHDRLLTALRDPAYRRTLASTLATPSR